MAGPHAASATAGRRGHPLRGQSGFTLIELLVVLSLISILAAMGMVQHRNSVLKAQEATLKTDLFHMRDAIDQYFADKGKYPASLDALVSDNYLRKIPEDPITQLRRLLADRSRGAGSEQPLRRAGHLRRQERRAGDGAGRDELYGLVGQSAVGGLQSTVTVVSRSRQSRSTVSRQSRSTVTLDSHGRQSDRWAAVQVSDDRQLPLNGRRLTPNRPELSVRANESLGLLIAHLSQRVRGHRRTEGLKTRRHDK